MRQSEVKVTVHSSYPKLAMVRKNECIGVCYCAMMRSRNKCSSITPSTVLALNQFCELLRMPLIHVKASWFKKGLKGQKGRGIIERPLIIIASLLLVPSSA
jgi:hypothetical protein